MIHNYIKLVNDSLAEALPKRCGVNIWNAQLNGLGKIVWSENDSQRFLHDQNQVFIVRDDRFDLQTCHVVDRVRKSNIESNTPIYTVECSWVGIGTTLTAGLLAVSIFDELGQYNIYVSEIDNNTERNLSSYWGIDKTLFGQNPDYNAWKISYHYTLSRLDQNDLMTLEGLNDLD
jgi:hypothetical protein